MPGPDLGRIKGAAFRGFVEWIERERGAAALDAMVAALPPEDLALLARGRPAMGILTGTWYPAAMVNRFLDRVSEGLTALQQKALARRGAEAIMGANVKGVYKALFTLFVSPRIYAHSIQRFWDLHYDSGTVETVQEGPRRNRSTIAGWRAHHPFGCLLNLASAYAIYGAMGCIGVRTWREACVGQGGPACVYVVEWAE